MEEHSSAPSTRPSLLRRIRDFKDLEAWHMFVDLYTPVICRCARRQSLQKEDMEDLVQDVFAQFTRQCRTFEYQPEKGRFRGYLYIMTLNAIRRRQKKEHRRAETASRADADIPLDELASAQQDTEFDADYRERVLEGAKERTREEFTPRTWQVFLEVWEKNRSPEEVAAEFGMSPGAVHTCKCRVLQRLEEEVLFLDEDGPHPLM